LNAISLTIKHYAVAAASLHESTKNSGSLVLQEFLLLAQLSQCVNAPRCKLQQLIHESKHQ
jgi:hypothetical protein